MKNVPFCNKVYFIYCENYIYSYRDDKSIYCPLFTSLKIAKLLKTKLESFQPNRNFQIDFVYEIGFKYFLNHECTIPLVVKHYFSHEGVGKSSGLVWV